uniref:Origin recognition complex subunit 2 n=1 Tax=Trichuris muris TaxID=70415 RepID=A0A5S6PYW6_TRIMR
MDKCKHSLGSLECVWASLTSKGIAAFVHLGQMALQSNTGASEASLRHHLVEFQDHHLVSTKTRSDGTDILHLEIDQQLLREFLKQHGINVEDEDN